MNNSNRVLLAAVFAFVCGSSVVRGQQTDRSNVSTPFAKVGQALAAFSVDESASKTGKITQSSGETVVAGPIELHLPTLSRPAWVGSKASTKPLARKRLQANAIPHNVHAQPPTHPVVEPMGTAQLHITPDQTYEFGAVNNETGYIMGIPSPSHQVIRSPGQSQSANSPGVEKSKGIHEKAKSIHERHQQTHPDHSSIHRRVQPEPPTIPGGREREVWKQPYSYGYFGASGDRHWSMQHGYRDRYTQWTRR